MMGHLAAASEGLMAVRASHDTWGQRHSSAGGVGVILAALQPCPAGSQEHEADVQGGQKAGAPGGCRKAGRRPSDQSWPRYVPSSGLRRITGRLSWR